MTNNSVKMDDFFLFLHAPSDMPTPFFCREGAFDANPSVMVASKIRPRFIRRTESSYPPFPENVFRLKTGPTVAERDVDDDDQGRYAACSTGS
jgi:hypothetical protein